MRSLSDPVDGKFLVLNTDDGEHWKELPRDRMPAALPKEGAFAASGTSIVLCGGKNIYFGTGGPAARVFRSQDRGISWTAVDTPLVSGEPSRGIFSVACDGRETLVAVGGDYKEPAGANKIAMHSTDAGKTWVLSQRQPDGYRSAVASLSHGDFVAVGTNGSDISHDAAVHWKHIDDINLNAVSFGGARGWGVGPKGTIARCEMGATKVPDGPKTTH